MISNYIPAENFPFKVGEVLTFCRVASSERELYERALIPAAFDLLESTIRRPIIKRTYCETFNGWPPHGYLYLSRGPVRNFESLEEKDSEGEFCLVDRCDYEIHPETTQPWIRVCCRTCKYRSCRCGCTDPILRATYQAGPDECKVDARMRVAFLNLVCSLGTYRGSEMQTAVKESPAFTRLIDSLRTNSVIAE